MTRIGSFRDLEVWQAAMDLVVAVYSASSRFPADERFGLIAQIRRAAISIPSNLAEGHGRGHGDGKDRSYLNHVRIALGSQAELGTQIEIAVRLGFLPADHAAGVQRDLARVRQMLHALRRSVENRRAVLLGTTLLAWLLGPARLAA